MGPVGLPSPRSGALRLPVGEVEKIASTPELRLARFYEMTVSGVAVNNVLPGRIGDLLRARWLGLAAACPQGGHSEPWCSTAHATSLSSSPCS